MKQKVSIITVTYNAQEHLEETMQHVFAQSYPNVEYILIDGGSTDGTVDIIKKHESQLALWRSEKDNGIYDAMNKGIQLAKGELIGLVNAGDYYEPDTVAQMVEAYKQHPECGIFHGDINLLNADGSFFKRKKPNTNLNDLYKGFSLYHPSFFVTNATYQKQGLYDTNFTVIADFDFALRCHLAGVKFCYVPQVISNFRQGGFSSSAPIDGKIENRNILLKNGYSENVINSVFRNWESAHRKEKILKTAYELLKKVLPLSILNKLAQHVSLK
ncbi:hypothetical protein AGMMS49982_18910 [Bacteroidia bacterium]|nr:hypothetical protein AGMMS49982_18910 [Bacteroidia bacterium]